MADKLPVPMEVVERLGAICLGLPETYEEDAWVGVRWRIRKRTFAHVLRVDKQWPAAYARAAAANGPVTVMTFRSPSPEVEVLGNAGFPYFRPEWGTNVAGLVIEDDTDWDEVAELLTESYCVQAPKKLVALVDRPASASGD